MLKASAGGGGKGLRVAKDDKSCREGFERARSEAASSFNDDRILIEKYIQTPRHIEVQVIGDVHGNYVYLGERECSIQRRHQKIIEEAPSPAVKPEIRARMGEAALSVARKLDYASAGTVEFLLDGEEFWFLEVNTRLQVEHPVTEMVTGIDIVQAQIRVATGDSLEYRQRDVEIQGHAVECRINAEDPANNFTPFPAKITSFHMPGGKGVRVDSHAYAGYQIPSQYDSMIGKLIVRAKNRDRAIIRMQHALEETIIEGPKTTIPYHQAIMGNEKFKSGDFDTSFLETFIYNPMD